MTNDESAAIGLHYRSSLAESSRPSRGRAPPTPESWGTDSEAAAQGNAGAAARVTCGFPRVLDEFGELGRRRSAAFRWSKWKIGDRIVTNITYDLGIDAACMREFDVGGEGSRYAQGAVRLPGSESSPRSHSRQMVYAAVGSSLTRSREVGVFLLR